MFQVLHSSAGAGKTHALVKHYLTLCLRGSDPVAYRQVLALTFTNKAASEMKDRVMLYLEAMAHGRVDTAPFADVMDHLTKASRCDKDAIAQRASMVLTHMLHHWGDVAIGTIDAFTRRVVKPFARDLRLDHELRMTTEQEYYRDLAVETLIGEAGTEPTLTGLLTEVCLQLLHEERTWDPEKPLRDLSGELNKESSIKPLQELGGLEPQAVVGLVQQLRQQERSYQEHVRTIGQDGLDLMARHGLRPSDFFQGIKGVPGHFRKLAAFEEVLPSPNSYVQKALDEDKWTGGKADASTQAAVQRIAPPLTALILKAQTLEGAEQKAFLLRRAVARELPTAYALHALDERLEALKRADGVTFFGDLTRKVAQLVKHEPVPFIHERMGERYRHFLIDEFQDTSLLQWGSLSPLIDNALSTGGSALLVGDAKQAIYRWRNGEVRLFTGLPRLFGKDPGEAAEAQREANLVRTHKPVPPLTGNHRSAPTIIAFNNKLFTLLSPLLPEGLRSVYDGHAQDIVRDGTGLVELRALDKTLKGPQREAAMLEQMMRWVNDVLEDGFAPGDIAILVRSKSIGRVVSSHLVSKGLQVVSPDGLQLSGDPFIQLLIHLLRFLHTEDAPTAARVLQYQAMLSAGAHEEHVDPFQGSTGMNDPVGTLRHWLREQGDPHLHTTLTGLVTQLARAHGKRPGEDVQLLTLLDETHSWTLRNGQDIGGFLEHWDRTGGDRSVAPPEHGEAVQVMTVHKSKGLQFPVVIVPNATMAAKGSHAAWSWIRPGRAVPDLPTALVREGKALRDAGVTELKEEEELRLLDALNLTYVAFTRPEQRLYALVHGGNSDVISKGLLDLITQEGGVDAHLTGERTGPWRSRDNVVPTPLGDVSGGDALRVATLRMEAPEEWDPSDPDPHRAFGNAVHHVLEQVHEPEDLDAAMADAVNAGLLAPETASPLLRRLKELLASPPLRPWFAKGSNTRTEVTIITPEGKALRPDRVVIDGTRVRVLDIKTGKATKAHHEQVREYMRRLGELGYTSVEGGLLYVHEGVVTAVSP